MWGQLLLFAFYRGKTEKARKWLISDIMSNHGLGRFSMLFQWSQWILLQGYQQGHCFSKHIHSKVNPKILLPGNCLGWVYSLGKYKLAIEVSMPTKALYMSEWLNWYMNPLPMGAQRAKRKQILNGLHVCPPPPCFQTPAIEYLYSLMLWEKFKGKQIAFE